MNYKAKKLITSKSDTLKYYFGFDYIDKSFIKVFLDGVPVENVEVNGTEVTLPKAPPDDKLLIIQRMTPTTPLVGWEDASILLARDMNLESLQLLHIVEENFDKTVDIGLVFDNKDGKLSAQGRVIKDVGYATEDKEAVTLDKFTELQKSIIGVTTTLTEAFDTFKDKVDKQLLEGATTLVTELEKNEKKLKELFDENTVTISEKLKLIEDTKTLVDKALENVEQQLKENQKDTLAKVKVELDSKASKMDNIIKQGEQIVQATSDIDERLKANRDYTDERVKELGVAQFEQRVINLEKGKEEKGTAERLLKDFKVDTSSFQEGLDKKVDKETYAKDKQDTLDTVQEFLLSPPSEYITILADALNDRLLADNTMTYYTGYVCIGKNLGLVYGWRSTDFVNRMNIVSKPSKGTQADPHASWKEEGVRVSFPHEVGHVKNVQVTYINIENDDAIPDPTLLPPAVYDVKNTGFKVRAEHGFQWLALVNDPRRR